MAELKPLTSIRGVAALAVVMQHFSASAQTLTTVPIPSLVPHGYVAVDLFYVLSGFIMALTYRDDFAARGLGAMGDFLGKRAARILPLQWFAIGLTLVAGVVSAVVFGHDVTYHGHRLAFDVAANALLLHGLGLGANLNDPSSSVSIEFAAYYLFPVFLWLVLFGGRARLALALIAAGLGLLWVVSGNERLSVETPRIPPSIARCFAEFALGMAAFRLIGVPRAAALLRRDSVALALMAWAAAWLLLRIDLPAVLSFPFLIASLALNRGRVAAFWSGRAVHFLGTVSFSIYLLHQTFRLMETELVRTLHPAPLSAPWALAFALVGTLSVLPFAALAYQLIERPGRVLVRAALASYSRAGASSTA
jgi:peptidoglycan/LPS O-acetylase OafA/YrhL